MLPIKPFRQRPGYCGPACLKMVLEYYGIKKTERELARLAGTSARWGTPARGLLKAAHRLGLTGIVKDNAQISDIRKYISKKIPAIVNWFSTDEGHYSVVVGIDKKLIYLQDPELAAIRKLDLVMFKRVWFDFHGDYIRRKSDIVLRRMVVLLP
ncbi:C39 family peptidase [Candidatus Woesearchaeota archaeon]|nr:C39 family peptidase [Candidatus Woesearchaeota archaeon]